MRANSMTDRLTPRELEVLYLIANGYSNLEVARTLYLSPHTIKVMVTGILRKLGVKNRTHAVFVASHKGLLRNGTLTVKGIKQKL